MKKLKVTHLWRKVTTIPLDESPEFFACRLSNSLGSICLATIEIHFSWRQLQSQPQTVSAIWMFSAELERSATVRQQLLYDR